MRMAFKSLLALAIIKFDLRGLGQCSPRWSGGPMMVAENR
jgi:hypothetical protein